MAIIGILFLFVIEKDFYSTLLREGKNLKP
jgi:hypothetical protein